LNIKIPKLPLNGVAGFGYKDLNHKKTKPGFAKGRFFKTWKIEFGKSNLIFRALISRSSFKITIEVKKDGI
jgi:hypothetical protein